MEKLGRRLSGTMLQTVVKHDLLEEGDRILVAISGGKDSSTLLELLVRSLRKAPIHYELVGYHLHLGQPGHDPAPLIAWLEKAGYPFETGREEIYSRVSELTADSDNRCRLCSRFRRGALYSAANRLKCNKIALGHHRDDAIQTLLLNLFFAGRMQAMPARYITNDGRFTVIRPLIECAEDEIAAYAAGAGHPRLPCGDCGYQEDSRRRWVAGLIEKLEREIPDVRQVMLAALGNVRPSHLLDIEVAEAWEEAASRLAPRR